MPDFLPNRAPWGHDRVIVTMKPINRKIPSRLRILNSNLRRLVRFDSDNAVLKLQKGFVLRICVLF